MKCLHCNNEIGKNPFAIRNPLIDNSNWGHYFECDKCGYIDYRKYDFKKELFEILV